MRGAPDPIAEAVHTEIARRLKALRKLKGLSQSDVADLTGVSYQQFQKYESGRNRIPAPRLYMVSVVLGVAIEDFFPD